MGLWRIRADGCGSDSHDKEMALEKGQATACNSSRGLQIDYGVMLPMHGVLAHPQLLFLWFNGNFN